MCLKRKIDNITEIKIKQTKNDITKMLNTDREKDILYNYEIIRQEGNYNMLDPRAREQTGCMKKEYNYIIENYTKLISKYPNIKGRASKYSTNKKSTKISKLMALQGNKKCKEVVSKK